jgi:O-methyltransferase involved in polyketide biosynthesis
MPSFAAMDETLCAAQKLGSLPVGTIVSSSRRKSGFRRQRDALKHKGTFPVGPSRSSIAFIFAMRSRFAEERLVEAAARGIRQYVMLGAYLDTFPWRPRAP